MKERTVFIENIEVHELAKLTPAMTEVQFEALKTSIEQHGQQVPVVTYRSRIIDGRHRLKALRELGLPTIVTVSEDSTMSEEDIRIKIMDVYENRRHQTPTQKAIVAYRVYAKGKADGEKIGQGEVAKEMGTTVKQLGRASTLHGLASDSVMDLLFNGEKLNTGTEMQPNYTDSLSALVTYYKKFTENLLEGSKASGNSEDFTDEEVELSNAIVRSITSTNSTRMVKRISSMMYYSTKDN